MTEPDWFTEIERKRDMPLESSEIGGLSDSDLDDRVWLRWAIDVADVPTLRGYDPAVRAYLATRLFEWEIGNGGLHQYFFNYPSPDLLSVVLEGYAFFGLDEVRDLVETSVQPIAAREQEWRESLRDGTIETFFDSYPETDFNDLDEQVGFHDEVRVAYIRANPELFAR